eukprot:tig00000857_g4930.t1
MSSAEYPARRSRSVPPGQVKIFEEERARKDARKPKNSVTSTRLNHAMPPTQPTDSAVSSMSDLAPAESFSRDSTAPHPKRCVIKIGTSSIMAADQQYVSLSTLSRLVETISSLRRKGFQVVLVTSGAVGIGCQRLRIAERPKQIAAKQAVAAIGQSRLMRLYDDLFQQWDQPIAQILLTRENLGERSGYTNAKNCFDELLQMGVVPIVNENDTVAIGHEIRFGDNDTLSALVASLIEAQWLFLLTDVQYLYDSDPRSNPEAKPVYEVPDLDDLSVSLGSTGSQWGTGGFGTKLQAAHLATAAGCTTIVTLARDPENIEKMLVDGAWKLGTVFLPKQNPIPCRKRWIVHGIVPQGTIMINDGAVLAVKDQRKSLLAAGIVMVEGEFGSDAAVRVVAAATGEEVARGITNYSSEELKKIQGLHGKGASSEALGFYGPDMVIHRSNLVRLK